uniref:Uncharacterized protein n=1 Tax=Aegilops tauschii subsp. strangulata TaxID=200361 RepID=A0A452ZZT1_AEGTS
TLHKESGAAATYDALDMRVDTHWTAKRAEEMTERDWRILREDFGISYRGSRVPRPMRSWAESGLGAELLRNVDRAGCRSRWPGITRMLVQSNSPVPPELARHEASKFKPGSVPGRPPRRNSTVHADG